MVTLRSVQGHTGLTHLFNFLTFEHSGAELSLQRLEGTKPISDQSISVFVL